MIFQRYIPKSFCREYVQIKGDAAQLSMFMSTVFGIKPLMDDWIPVDRVEEFKKICKQYGLKTREGVIFQQVAKEDFPDDVLGREYLTTTNAYGYPLDSKKKGQVHLFISKDQKLLKKGMWYPVTIKKRVIFQPRMDGLNYGYVLGYPECCIKFFRKYNDWLKFSNLYEAYLNTKNKPQFFCNPFLKDLPFSYIYHMPCSYSCAATIEIVTKLRNEIKKREPEFVELTDKCLKLPFLVFYERKFYCFEGTLKNNEIKYRKAYFAGPDPSKDIYGEYFKEADTVRLQGRELIILKNNRVIKKANIKLSDFAPEYPFMIKFS